MSIGIIARREQGLILAAVHRYVSHGFPLRRNDSRYNPRGQYDDCSQRYPLFSSRIECAESPFRQGHHQCCRSSRICMQIHAHVQCGMQSALPTHHSARCRRLGILCSGAIRSTICREWWSSRSWNVDDKPGSSSRSQNLGKGMLRSFLCRRAEAIVATEGVDVVQIDRGIEEGICGRSNVRRTSVGSPPGETHSTRDTTRSGTQDQTCLVQCRYHRTSIHCEGLANRNGWIDVVGKAINRIRTEKVVEAERHSILLLTSGAKAE
mmetsp:Transcript_13848/g.32209  ORF Transcript_13848/g.32209 Transcript_13848/m.32209 type:complete len:265 (+) Transcript_13848:54-848(+)